MDTSGGTAEERSEGNVKERKPGAFDEGKAREAGKKSGEVRRNKGLAGPVEAKRAGPPQQLRDYRWVWENETGPDATAGRRRARKAFETNPGKFEDRLERMEKEEAAKNLKADLARVEKAQEAGGVDVGERAALELVERMLGEFGR